LLLGSRPNAGSHFALREAIRVGARLPPAPSSFIFCLAFEPIFPFASEPCNRRRTRCACYRLYISIDLIDRFGTQQGAIEKGQNDHIPASIGRWVQKELACRKKQQGFNRHHSKWRKFGLNRRANLHTAKVL
jgi:hypothetical protein